MSSSMKAVLEKVFDLCKKYQEEIPPQKMAEILRDYAERLDGYSAEFVMPNVLVEESIKADSVLCY